jgi:uncharacterized protein (DUF433 family)
VLYSYRDLVALRMFVRLRGDLSLQRVRRAVAWLQADHPDAHLSAHTLRAVPGQQTAVWIAPDGGYIDVVEHPGQGLKVVMDDIFDSFETRSGRRVPALAEPTDGVTVDPDVRSGYPVIKGTRIPYNVVASLHADGMDAREIARLYPSITERQVRGAAELADLVAASGA